MGNQATNNPPVGENLGVPARHDEETFLPLLLKTVVSNTEVLTTLKNQVEIVCSSNKELRDAILNDGLSAKIESFGGACENLKSSVDRLYEQRKEEMDNKKEEKRQEKEDKDKRWARVTAIVFNDHLWKILFFLFLLAIYGKDKLFPFFTKMFGG